MTEAETLLRDALKACDDNRTTLAARVGVERQHIQNWLKSKRGPPSWRLDALRKVARRK